MPIHEKNKKIHKIDVMKASSILWIYFIIALTRPHTAIGAVKCYILITRSVNLNPVISYSRYGRSHYIFDLHSLLTGLHDL